MPVPAIRVEIAFNSAPDDPVQTWVDVTSRVAFTQPITISRGRSDEQSDAEPGRLSMTLHNRDGWFTWGYTSADFYDDTYTSTYSSADYFPDLKPRRRVRVSVSPDGGTYWSPRFDGYVDSLQSYWAGGVTEAPRVTLTATDRLARFGAMRTLRDALHEELGTAGADQSAGWVLDDPTWSVLDSTTVLAGGVVWLYGLQEQQGAVTAGDVSGAPGRPVLTLTQTGSEGTAEAGTAGIMPEGTAWMFTPASTGNGLTLGSSAARGYTGTEFSLWCQFAWSGSSGATLVTLGTGLPKVTLATTSTTVTATLTGDTAASATATKTISTNDGRPHFALVTVSGSTVSLYVDEESAATASVPTGMGLAQGLAIGGTATADPHQVAWVGYGNAATSAARAAELGMLGSGGSERSDLRVARILRWLGVDSDADLETGLSDIAYQATGDRQALDLIHDVNAVEGGVLFPTGSGMLAFHSRGHRYNPDTALSLAAEDVSGDLRIVLDGSQLLNEYQVSRPRGATYLVRDEASIADYGAQARSETLYAASDEDLRSVAEWRLARYSAVQPRIPEAGLDLLTLPQATAAAALALEVGDLIEVTGMPATTTPGGATVPLFVEGMDETVSATSWTLRLTTSRGDWGTVWQLDDATYSVLGTSTTVAY